jgi:hypothetical protein
MNEVSVIIPIGDAYNGKAMPDRWEALAFSIRTFYAKHKALELVIVLQDTMMPGKVVDVINKFMCLGKRYAKIIPIEYKTFNKGWCCNVGAKAARFNTIAIAESDMWAPKPYLNEITECDWIIAWDNLCYTSEVHRKMILSGIAVSNDIAERRGSMFVHPTIGASEGGMVLFNKKFFFSIGGCNEWFEELGGPDNEIARRAQFASKTYIMHNQTVYHLWHPKCRNLKNPIRLKNVKLYKSTCRHLKEFNTFLSKQQFGNPEAPLRAHKTFKEAWNESHQNAAVTPAGD